MQQWTAADLEAAIQAGTKTISHKYFRDEDLSHLQASGMHRLQGMRLEHCEFSNCDFSGVILSDIHFEHCKFNLSTNLETREIVGCIFDDCSFNAQFRNSKINYTHFTDCSWDGSNMIDCTIVKCEFSSCNWFELNAGKAVFENCTFKKIEVEKSIFNQGVFTWPEVDQLGFLDCFIRDAYFGFGKLEHVAFNSCQMQRTAFTYTEFTDVAFQRTDVTKGEFQRSTMHSALFLDSTLKDARFLNTVTVHSVILMNTDVSGTYWQTNPPGKPSGPGPAATPGVTPESPKERLAVREGDVISAGPNNLRMSWRVEEITIQGGQDAQIGDKREVGLRAQEDPYVLDLWVFEYIGEGLIHRVMDRSVPGDATKVVGSWESEVSGDALDWDDLIEAIRWAELTAWSEPGPGQREETEWEHGPEYKSIEELKPIELREGPIPEIPELSDEEKQAFAEAVAEYSKLGGSQASFTEEQMERWRRLSPEIYENPRSAKALMGHCQLRWEIYDAKPTKKNLMAFGRCIGRMKASKSARVKQERRRALRAFRKEMRDTGWKMPKKDPTEG
jgi:fluoroquinolone resistance protein